MPTAFKALAELGEKLEATTKRLLMIDLTADFLKILESKEVEHAVSMLLARPFGRWDSRVLEVSWATLSEIIRRIAGARWKVFGEAFSRTGDIGAAAKAVFESSKTGRQSALFERALTILEVRNSFEAISETAGVGSKEKKERLIEVLLSQASPVEVKYLVKIIIGEMRTGLYEGLMEQAVSKAFDIRLQDVQRAGMFTGDIATVASIAKSEGGRGLSRLSFSVFRPVGLMLAQVSDDVEAALKEHAGGTGFEYKYDGVRVQVHKSGMEVRIFSRRLTDVTDSLPEVVDTVRKNIAVNKAIFEGEVVAVDDSGYPIPFQHLMRRLRRVHGVEDAAERIPVKLYLFDVLYLDGESMISVPYERRRHVLAANAGAISLTSQLITADLVEANRFLREAISAGHEGLMAKRLDSVYTPGIRGKSWLKVKPTLEPLDLVIVAAEWGYGRRHGWLSDYYLAARDGETGEFQMVGKTFKGLTDDELVEMTRRLKELGVSEESRRVVVVPKIVVEVAYNEIQRSPKYECGMALRFARIVRIRDDKTVSQADTIEKVRRIYEGQFEKKGRYITD